MLVVALSLSMSLAILVATLAGASDLRGIDFRIFYTAGWALRQGIDPYNAPALARASIAATGIISGPPLGAFPYLPWVGWAMAPWSLVPYTTALALWELLSWALVLGAANLWARHLGWYRSWPVSILASVSTVALLDYKVGQFDAVAMGLVVVTSAAAGRGRWLLAGLVATVVVLLKPQLALPLLPLLWVLAVRERGSLRSALTGQAIAVVVLMALPSILQPSRMRAWILLVVHFSHGIGHGQLALAGLAGLVNLLPSWWHLSTGLTSPITIGLVTAGLAAMALITHHSLLTGDQSWSQTQRAGWCLLLPLAIWLLATPYVHAYDVLILLPLLILALGPDGVELRRPLAWVVVGAFLALPLAFLPTTARIRTVGSLTSLAVLALVLFAGKVRYGKSRSQARDRQVSTMAD